MQITSQGGFTIFPRDVLSIIISHCPARDFITSLPLVCRAFNSVANDPVQWRRIAPRYVHQSRLPNDLKESFIRELKKTNCAVRIWFKIQFGNVVGSNPFDNYARFMNYVGVCNKCKHDGFSSSQLSDSLIQAAKVNNIPVVDFLSRSDILQSKQYFLNEFLNYADIRSICIIYENNKEYFEKKQEPLDLYLRSLDFAKRLAANPTDPVLCSQLRERQIGYQRHLEFLRLEALE